MLLCLLLLICVCVLVSAHHRQVVPTPMIFGLPKFKVRTPIQSHRLSSLEHCDQISHDVHSEVVRIVQALIGTRVSFYRSRMPGGVTG